ncbi:hypothetical protein TorRG33x02_330220 [Trema orientale]|uniref:Uncharacterized protein n=1 Tax=Trema orientale TaxID=63057 RepID=A0A2P5B7E4_TREOI|nr:hypothetical protein TorRG33x02_330220 [Trema orientale]
MILRVTRVVVVVVATVSPRGGEFVDARRDLHDRRRRRRVFRRSFGQRLERHHAPQDGVVEAGADSRRHERNEGRLRAEYAGAAEGAVGVGAKPHVDAVHVEGVGADRERTDVVVLFELDEANGAVAGGPSTTAFTGCVDGEGDGLDDGVVEPVRGEHVEPVAGLERRVVRQGVEVASGGREVGPPATAAAPPPTSEESEDGRDDVSGDKAGVGDDQEGGGHHHHHGYQRRTEVNRKLRRRR